MKQQSAQDQYTRESELVAAQTQLYNQLLSVYNQEDSTPGEYGEVARRLYAQAGIHGRRLQG